MRHRHPRFLGFLKKKYKLFKSLNKSLTFAYIYFGHFNLVSAVCAGGRGLSGGFFCNKTFSGGQQVNSSGKMGGT